MVPNVTLFGFYLPTLEIELVCTERASCRSVTVFIIENDNTQKKIL